MAISYTWIIQSLDCAPLEDGLTNVVKTVHWQYKGTDIDNTNYSCYGFTNLSSPNPDDFIAYDDLTLAIVGGWLDTIVDLIPIQSSITTNIANIQNPPIIPLPLPPTGSNS